MSAARKNEIRASLERHAQSGCSEAVQAAMYQELADGTRRVFIDKVVLEFRCVSQSFRVVVTNVYYVEKAKRRKAFKEIGEQLDAKQVHPVDLRSLGFGAQDN